MLTYLELCLVLCLLFICGFGVILKRISKKSFGFSCSLSNKNFLLNIFESTRKIKIHLKRFKMAPNQQNSCKGDTKHNVSEFYL